MPIEINQNKPVILAYEGPLSGSSWPVDRNLVIGRDSECDISITERQVSRQHAKIESAGNSRIQIIDLNSKNGTYVNGDRISGSQILKDGDEIKIALIQQFVFISSDATLPLNMRQPAALEKNQKLFVDENARRVWIGDKELLPALSVPQYKLLVLLYRSENSVVTREFIVNSVWGENESIGVSEQALDALVRRLRERLKKDDPTHDYIKTIRGVGFIFANDTFED